MGWILDFDFGFDFDLAGFGCAVLPLDCVFFFFFGSATGFVVMASGPTVEVVEVVVAGGSTVGWVSMAPSEWVLGQWVAGWVCCLGFFFFGC